MAKSSNRLLQIWGSGGALEKSAVESAFVTAMIKIGLTWKVQYWDLDKDNMAQVGAVADKIVVLAPKEKTDFWCEAVIPLKSKAEVWAIDPCVPIQQILVVEVNRWIAKLISGETQKENRLEAQTAPQIIPVLAKETKVLLPKAKKISVGRETKGRAGKGVTTLFDIPLNTEQIKELATTLKQKCGTGGTVKEGCIEIQGDQRERIVQVLEKLGFQVKRVGG